MSYIYSMIRSFKHKGLKNLWEKNNGKGLDDKYAKKMRVILTALDAAVQLSDLSAPNLALHPLKGNKKNQPVIWSVTAYANWRITFEWIERDNGTPEVSDVQLVEAGGDVSHVDLVDYHKGHH